MTSPGKNIPGYEQIEHTADTGFRARGRTLEDLFECAATALVEIMLDTTRAEELRSVGVEAAGSDNEELLVGWLEEILFAFEVQNFVPARIKVDKLEEGYIKGRLFGEEFDEQKHPVQQPVKAVTYHSLRIKGIDGGYEVTVIVDV